MEFYFSAPLWDDDNCPHTSEQAKPTNWHSVTNATVMKITNGTYRDAVFDGVFVLDEKANISTDNAGQNKGIFFCRWFGHRLQTRGIEIKFNPATAETIKGYTGDVVSNLSL